MSAVLQRESFVTSRQMDFFSEKELVAQTGHAKSHWPAVALKELLDNALDGCEDADKPPEITVITNEKCISVSDNGPGIAPDVVESMLDFSARISSREAYVAPDRGAQGNALKTIVAMPCVLDGDHGRVEIAARGVHHNINTRVDRIRQQPVIDHGQEVSDAKNRHLCNGPFAEFSRLDS